MGFIVQPATAPDKTYVIRSSGVVEANQRAGEYELWDEIGEGGVAKVFVGLKRGGAGFRSAVAIKMLRAEHIEDAARLEMIIDEARLASKIRHPNVIHVQDVIARERGIMLVMPLVRGVSLDRVLAKLAGEPCPVEIAVAIAADALAGLEAAHSLAEGGRSLGVIHRDVSPSNLLVGVDGTTGLLDFGIAKYAGRIHATTHGQRKGKLAYMAPEQLEGDVDARTDVYGLAAVLWQLLVGRPVHVAASPRETVDAILSAAVIRPSRARPGLPRALDGVVLRGLERDRAQRWSSAREMLRALEGAHTRAPPGAVGAWLESLVSEELAELDRLVARAEQAPSPLSPVPVASPKGGRSRLRRFAPVLVVLAATAGVVLARTRASDEAHKPPDAPRIADSAAAPLPSGSSAVVVEPVEPGEPVEAPPSPSPSSVAVSTPAASPRPSHRPAAPRGGGDRADRSHGCTVSVYVDGTGKKHYTEVCPR